MNPQPAPDLDTRTVSVSCKLLHGRRSDETASSHCWPGEGIIKRGRVTSTLLSGPPPFLKKPPKFGGLDTSGCGPGPGHYALPPTIGYINHDYTKPSSPAYSFHRHLSSKMLFEDCSPGPQYHVDDKITRFGRDGTPSYSMLGRKKVGADKFQTPGPGAYSPEKAPPLNWHRRPPSYTMAFRTRYRSVDAVPAPNRYTLPNLLGSRIPNKPSSASYSMSRRMKPGAPSEDLATTPGPAHYNRTDPSVYMKRQPSFSIQSRHNVPSDATCKPGPGTHCPEKVMVHLPRPPSFTMGQDPTNDFSIIPSWNKEFVYLIGLEEVVQFRLEWLDMTVYTAPNKHRTRGRPKKFPIPAVVPATLPKDPYTCVKCNTDVSCSWKLDMNSSILCHACVKCSWRKDHWLYSGPTETIIKSVSDNSSSLTSSSKPVWNDPQSMKEAVFPLQHSSHSVPQACDQQVPKNSLSSSSNFHPDSPFYCSSPLSSDLSSPPGFYSDTSSQWSCSFSSDDHPYIYHSSSSPGSSLCDGSSPSYLPSYSDLSSSSSSMSPTPSGCPPKNSSKWVSQKGKTPYWMETPLAKALLIDDKAEQETKKVKEEQLTRNKSQCKEEKTEKMAALSVPSSSLNRRILPKTQSALPDSVPSSSPLLSVSKHQFQTQMLTPNLQKTTSAEKNKLTKAEGLKPGHGSLQKVTPNMSCGYVSSTKLGSSTYSLDSGKSKTTICYLPTTWSAVSGNVRQQDSRSIPRCFDENKRESIMKNEKFGTKVQHQASHSHPSSSRVSSAPTHASFLSQTALSSNQRKTIPQNKVKWEAAPNQKIDKWVQKPESSMGSHGSCSSCSSSSSSFDHPEKVNQQVLVSPKMKTFHYKVQGNS